MWWEVAACEILAAHLQLVSKHSVIQNAVLQAYHFRVSRDTAKADATVGRVAYRWGPTSAGSRGLWNGRG